jgi:hypothetical protein
MERRVQEQVKVKIRHGHEESLSQAYDHDFNVISRDQCRWRLHRRFIVAELPPETLCTEIYGLHIQSP